MNEMDSAGEMDAALDARLRAAFAPPRDVQRMAREVLAQSGVVRPVSRWRHLRSVAAILVVAVGLGWLGWFASREVSTQPVLVSIDVGQLHAQIATELGEPVSCTSPEESGQLVAQIVGTEFDYRGGARVPLQGPFALPVDWPGDPAATVLAGHFEERVVVVVIESVELSRGPGLDPTEKLRVYRREVGDYVLYEISSGKAPVCLDEFSLGTAR